MYFYVIDVPSPISLYLVLIHCFIISIYSKNLELSKMQIMYYSLPKYFNVLENGVL